MVSTINVILIIIGMIIAAIAAVVASSITLSLTEKTYILFSIGWIIMAVGFVRILISSKIRGKEV